MTTSDPDAAQEVADEAETLRAFDMLLTNAEAVRTARRMPPDAVVAMWLPASGQFQRILPALLELLRPHPIDLQLYPTDPTCIDPREDHL